VGRRHALCTSCASRFCSAKPPATTSAPPTAPSPPHELISRWVTQPAAGGGGASEEAAAAAAAALPSPQRSTSQVELFLATPLRIQAPTCPFCRQEVEGFAGGGEERGGDASLSVSLSLCDDASAAAAAVLRGDVERRDAVPPSPGPRMHAATCNPLCIVPCRVGMQPLAQPASISAA
jgi:hypothetical protein